MDALAVRADPRGAVAHAPCVFCKAGWTDGKAAETGSAKRCFVSTAMTDTVAAASATAFSAGTGTCCTHFCC